MTLQTAVSIAVGLSVLVTFVGTKLWDAYRMKRTYKTIADCEACMKERQKVEGKLTRTLDMVEDRLRLGNFMLLRLWRQAKIPEDELKDFQQAQGITLDPGGDP